VDIRSYEIEIFDLLALVAGSEKCGLPDRMRKTQACPFEAIEPAGKIAHSEKFSVYDVLSQIGQLHFFFQSSHYPVGVRFKLAVGVR
jgi:hypothetical protein